MTFSSPILAPCRSLCHASFGGGGASCASEQIGVRSSVGEREDEFAVCGVEVEKNPVVLDMAVAKSFKVAGERMILMLVVERLAVGQFEDDIIDLIDVLAATKHLLQVLAKSLRPKYSVFHASRNSVSFAGSSQNCALGEFTSAFASLYASTSRWCLLFRASVKGIPPTSRILAKKQLKAVDMFMPMSSSMSSTSALSSASVRNVMLVVIDCTPVVRRTACIISYCADEVKEAA